MHKEYCVIVFDETKDVFTDDPCANYLEFEFKTIDKAINFAKEMLDEQDKVVVIYPIDCEE